MRILVTGTDGYLGSLLAPTLIEAGHEVIGVDCGYYRSGWLYSGVAEIPLTLSKDIRHISAEDLEGVDAVVAMAELSNDPLGDLISDITWDINHGGSARLARLAKECGVKRFVYMSSCSVYGIAEGTVDETSPLNPQTTYGRCKALVEEEVAGLADENFVPTFLRNATAFGASPRMRFDIVLNNLAGLAWVEKTIAMNSDGTPWRPLVHALDIGKAIRCVLDADDSVVRGQTFNVGSNDNNYTVRQIAETVAEVFPGCVVTFGPSNPDNRSYQVNFDKIHAALPAFSCDWSARDGAQQLYDVFDLIQLDAETFYGRGHTRLKQIEYLMKTGQVDAELFWKKAGR